jgi:hypothetical protein
VSEKGKLAEKVRIMIQIKGWIKPPQSSPLLEGAIKAPLPTLYQWKKEVLILTCIYPPIVFGQNKCI